ncbi:hypothetical protein N7499_012212 [Penicillium canescens]|uniref:Hydrophobin n=1 Tax=Penicillium canescens TaxID=5083 RepID=A0AAD6N411_PENCN|nr:uncharacterized protein N7446_001140 [Penicillium canescens]KAJ6013175.1 hypothetical protein N7522_003530 [Penicillium canescens]KAJ6029803.1 hypothetical protein N7460_010069 [Penicillium canescens]KAJ6060176.1 hypothetical protein N7444_002030 [Penicillium canescens]KAJ6063532.1 hypothetical protein N7499_012212 [Penicillium canescens]KAJ6078204.1 hypothetical protein N7446_001140 [Penicillium canescens]
MKASIISVISFALAVAALPPTEHSGKQGKYSIIKSEEQCQGGNVSCCSPKSEDTDNVLLSLLDGLNVLGVKDSYCSPISIIGPLNLALLGTVNEEKGNFDCKHTVACCNGEDCRPLSKKY